jgi:hydrogenase/urease accessory protein HupE
MAETTAGSEMKVGLGLLLGFVALLAALAMAGTAYVAVLEEEAETMQLLSGVALAVALVAGGIAVAAIHIYE